MAVLEREALLAALDARLAEAARGAGSLVAVGGEAGVGKSTLVRSFCEAHRGRAVIAWGACDAMQTARPLGPLHDVARMTGGRLAETIENNDDRHTTFTAFLDMLNPPRTPVVVVFEDVHWADEATLDLLVFLGRRVAQTRALALATFRDDEVGADHPLRMVLGDLATASAVHRIEVPRLSRVAVGKLAAGTDIDADRLFDVTGGNAFFVTEVLAVRSDRTTVPSSVSDAVLARVARLSPSARRAIDTAAVVPERVDVALLCAVGHVTEDAVDECQEAGILVHEGPDLRFRHELARLAVEQALPAGRRMSVHARVLAFLSAQPGTEVDRLAHHAEQAGDGDAVRLHAERAARRATALGAHREAAAQYARMLRFSHGLSPRQRAEILERFADECRATNQIPEAIEASGRALAVWEELGDIERRGALMARRAMFLWSAGRNDEGYACAEDAVRLLEDHPGPGLAEAYAYHAYLRMLARDIGAAIANGNRAVSLIESGRPWLLARALNAVGSALWFVDPGQALPTLQRSLAVAMETDDHDVTAGALCNLGSGSGEVRLYDTAEHWLRETITWCEERDLDTNHMYAIAWLSRVQFERGAWSAALTSATRVVRSGTGYVPTQIVALTVLGRLRARRGDPDPAVLLDEAWDLAARTRDLQRTWPVAAGRAEAAFLAGDVDSIPGLVGDTLDEARRLGHAWAIGELGYWLWRSGALVEPPDGAAEPYALQMRGRPRAAEAEWRRLGCPYEAAVALAESDGDLDDLTRAHAELSALGAWPAADAVARRLRELGQRRLPRRPRRATAENPARLTGREMEVLRLISADLRNADIAARLHISTKTVDHHVSAILTKLGVSTRRDAGRVAERLLAPKDGDVAGAT